MRACGTTWFRTRTHRRIPTTDHTTSHHTTNHRTINHRHIISPHITMVQQMVQEVLNITMVQGTHLTTITCLNTICSILHLHRSSKKMNGHNGNIPSLNRNWNVNKLIEIMV